MHGQLGRGKVSQTPINVFRIVCLLTWQYITVWFGYAIIFRMIYHYDPNLYIGVAKDTTSNWLFFSISNLTTLGYSGIVPCQNHYIIQAVITSEVLLGIFFVVLLLGAIIGRLDLKFYDEGI